MWMNILSVTLIVLFHFLLLCQGSPIVKNTIESNHRNKRSVYNTADENPWIDYWNENDDGTEYTLFPDDESDKDRTYPELTLQRYILRDFLPKTGYLEYLRKRGGNGREYPVRGRNPHPSRDDSHRPYNKCKRGRAGVGTWADGC